MNIFNKIMLLQSLNTIEHSKQNHKKVPCVQRNYTYWKKLDSAILNAKDEYMVFALAACYLPEDESLTWVAYRGRNVGEMLKSGISCYERNNEKHS